MKLPTPFICAILLLSFGSLTPRVRAEESGELSRLRSGYESAVERAVAPLEKRYLDHLRKLQSKFTRHSNLDAAIQVKEEIKIVEQQVASRKSGTGGNPGPGKSAAETFSDFLQKSEFSWDGSNGKITILFNKDKVVVNANGIEIMEKDYQIPCFF